MKHIITSTLIALLLVLSAPAASAQTSSSESEALESILAQLQTIVANLKDRLAPAKESSLTAATVLGKGSRIQAYANLQVYSANTPVLRKSLGYNKRWTTGTITSDVVKASIRQGFSTVSKSWVYVEFDTGLSGWVDLSLVGPAISNAFIVDQRVEARVAAKVNPTADYIPESPTVPTQKIGMPGYIKGGPEKWWSNIIYWKVDFENGVDGWVREVDLVKIGSDLDLVNPTMYKIPVSAVGGGSPTNPAIKTVAALVGVPAADMGSAVDRLIIDAELTTTDDFTVLSIPYEEYSIQDTAEQYDNTIFGQNFALIYSEDGSDNMEMEYVSGAERISVEISISESGDTIVYTIENTADNSPEAVYVVIEANDGSYSRTLARVDADNNIELLQTEDFVPTADELDAAIRDLPWPELPADLPPAPFGGASAPITGVNVVEGIDGKIYTEGTVDTTPQDAVIEGQVQDPILPADTWFDTQQFYDFSSYVGDIAFDGFYGEYAGGGGRGLDYTLAVY